MRPKAMQNTLFIANNIQMRGRGSRETVVFCFGFFSHISERVAQFFEVPRYVSAKGVAKQANYRWCACDVMAAILDKLLQKHLINFYCMWNQHGRRIIVLCILRNWLQPTY